MVVALCTAVMSKSRVCPRLSNSVCKIKLSIASTAGWVLAIPVTGSEIRAGGRMQRQEGALLLFLLSGQEGLRKQLLLLGQVILQPFFSITYCPIHSFFASVVAPAWGFGALLWAKKGQRQFADLAVCSASL